MRTIFRFFPVATALLILVLSGFTLPAAAGREPDLVIVHTSDIHAHYRPFEDRRGELRGGVARIAHRIAELRERHAGRVLYLDSGDLFQGTPFYHFYRGALGLELLERMGCEAMALGNHELDDGSLNMLRMSLSVPFPLLCANLSYPGGEPLLPAAASLELGGLRLEVLGLITAAMPELAAECGSGALITSSPAAALDAWLDSPEVAAADLPIVLSHCGIGEDREFAGRAPLILGGHSHTFLSGPETIGATALIHSGCNGHRLGIVEAYRERDGDWRFEYRYEEVTADWPEDPDVAALLERAGRVVDREMNTVLATLPEPFETRGKSGKSDPLGLYIADVMRRAADADLGLQNTGGYRVWLPAGPVTRGKIFELLPFDNRVVKLTFSGAALRDVFDFLAASFATGRFGQLAGASYGIVDGRAVDILIGGRPLDEDGRYTLAAPDFLCGGGDGYDCLAAALASETLDAFARDLIEEDLLERGAPRPADFPANLSLP